MPNDPDTVIRRTCAMATPATMAAFALVVGIRPDLYDHTSPRARAMIAFAISTPELVAWEPREVWPRAADVPREVMAC